MILCEELYFEITLTGIKSELKKFISCLKSGELDDFFEFSSDYISYDDEYADAGDGDETSIVITNDDLGIEIDELDTDEFLDVFCRAARSLDVSGHIYDIDDEEYRFISHIGNAGFINAKNIDFADELDIEARREEFEEDSDF